MFLSPYSPEFSAIENLFGHIKRKIKDFQFQKKEQLSKKITNELFGISND